MSNAKASGLAPTADPNEQTPLLIAPTVTETASEETVIAVDHAPEPQNDQPLPKAQILLLCYGRLIEPIAFFGIFPYINQMVQKNGSLREEDVGFYSGLIESLFSLTQMVVMIFWGRMADRLGRKPVLVVSLFGVGLTTALFGFATTIWQMMLFRCLAGVFAGSIVTIRAMITELSTKQTQARAFSFFAVAGNLGIFLGPLIGGALAAPAEQYGGIFLRTKLFRLYPYSLPTIVTGLIGIAAAVTTMLFVKETKMPTKAARIPDDESASTSNDGDPESIWDLIRYPGVSAVLYIYAHTMLLAFAYTAIVPLFWYTSPALGGFGFSSLLISLFMGLTGFAQAIWLLLVFPPLHQRIGTGGVMNVCAAAYPWFFLICPLLNLLLRHDTHATTIIFWVVGPPILAIGVGVSMAFTAVQLALNDISPSTEVLGTLNALALTLISGIRAFSPWLFTSIFALGAKTQVLGGYLIWAVLIALGMGLIFAVRWLPEKSAGTPQATKTPP